MAKRTEPEAIDPEAMYRVELARPVRVAGIALHPNDPDVTVSGTTLRYVTKEHVAPTHLLALRPLLLLLADVLGQLAVRVAHEQRGARRQALAAESVGDEPCTGTLARDHR